MSSKKGPFLTVGSHLLMLVCTQGHFTLAVPTCKLELCTRIPMLGYHLDESHVVKLWQALSQFLN